MEYIAHDISQEQYYVRLSQQNLYTHACVKGNNVI